MTLSEVYFYIIIILCLLLNVFIITTTEDIKVWKYYKRYLKVTLIIGFLGVFMELLGWNYFCKFNCILLTFSPFISLNIIKGITKFYEKIFKREPFQMDRYGLSHGIWVNNKGDLKYKNYYSAYSVSLMTIPILIILASYAVIEKITC